MDDFSVLEHLHTPCFWIDKKGQIRWWNTSAKEKFPFLHINSLWEKIRSTLPEGYIFHIHENFYIASGTLIECIPDANLGIVRRLQELREDNRQLELIFQESFDEVYVTDGNGITLHVNKAVERLYGISMNDLIGRSVFDLEREGVFNPSVTGLAIQHRKPVTCVQTTKGAKQLMTTANPVFDEHGDIQFVISTAKESDSLNPLQNESTGLPVQQFANAKRPDSQLVSHSESIRKLMQLAQRVANTDAAVLLLGETGVGKNRMAQFLHEHSQRKNGPFVHVNCATIPATLIESELFGYEPGSFTGAMRGGKHGILESAHEGTLFLNEIGEMPLELQGKLLDFIQEKTITRVGGTRAIPVDARIISATNRDLKQMVEDGTFRADLYFRLHVVPLEIPPLRERTTDIPELVATFQRKLNETYSNSYKELTPEVMITFLNYSWPGNVRELENLMERLTITSDGPYITVDDLPAEIQNSSQREKSSAVDVHVPQIVENSESPLRMIDRLERSIYQEYLRTHRSTYEIAKALGVSQATVVRKIKQHGLRAEK